MCDQSRHAGKVDRLLHGAILALILTRLAAPVAGADTALSLRGGSAHGGSKAAPFDVQVEVEEIVCELPAYEVTAGSFANVTRRIAPANPARWQPAIPVGC
jgi:hypothetical protein